jgi:putative hemolysin
MAVEVREGKYLLKLAENSAEKEQVYKLRHNVYHTELNLAKQTKNSDKEYDHYDGICDHLLIRDEETNRCVGTFRFLQGNKQGDTGFYAEQWFDIGALDRLRGKILEIGRACIDAQYRNTRVFKMLFSGVKAYLNLYPHDYLIGLTTLPFHSERDMGTIVKFLTENKAVNNALHIKPKKPLTFNVPKQRLEIREKEMAKKMSTLMWGYYKYGAQFVSEPSICFDFNPPVIDFFTLFETEKLPAWLERYDEKP